MISGAWKDGKVERTFWGQVKYHTGWQGRTHVVESGSPWPRMVMFIPRERTLEGKNGVILWSAF